MMQAQEFDTVVIGGGPSGATAATELAQRGLRVLMLERAFRIKPCGGAIPPRLIEDFDIPQELLVAKVTSARMISPGLQKVDMPVGDTYVGMVDRAEFDPWLRQRAVAAGAEQRIGSFKRLERRADGDKENRGAESRVTASTVIGADGANSRVAHHYVPGGDQKRCVFAYHEILRSPEGAAGTDFDRSRADVWYQGKLSPDFYAWVFPHGDTTSVGVGSEQRGFSATESVAALRREVCLDGAETLRREGAPIPLKPLKRWDDGSNIVLAGDAAGVVAPASGEGIYYAMLGGQLAAEAVAECRQPRGEQRAHPFCSDLRTQLTGPPAARPWPARANASCASTAGYSGCSASCRNSGTPATSVASASCPCARTPTSSTSPGRPTPRKSWCAPGRPPTRESSSRTWHICWVWPGSDGRLLLSQGY